MDFFSQAWASIVAAWNKIAGNAGDILTTIIKIILIILAAKLIIVIGNALSRRIIKSRRKRKPDAHSTRKAETLTTVLKSLIRYIVYFFAAATILGELGLGITAGSLLATAGIGGLALGLGAQGLIKDVVSGFFLLFEDQFAVGEYVKIADTEGSVEAVTIRITKLRAFTGELITIPNGTIDVISNYTRGHMVALVDVVVARNADVRQAKEVMMVRAREYAACNGHVVDEPILFGIQEITANGIRIRLILKVKALTHWKTERELRNIIYEAFVEAGIAVATPNLVILENDDIHAFKTMPDRKTIVDE